MKKKIQKKTITTSQTSQDLPPELPLCYKCGVYKAFENITDQCCANNGEKCTFPQPTKNKEKSTRCTTKRIKPDKHAKKTISKKPVSTIWSAPHDGFAALGQLCEALKEAHFPTALRITGDKLTIAPHDFHH